MSPLPYATGILSLGMLLLSALHFTAVGWHSARARLRARSLRQRRQSHLRRESQHARLASELSWQTATGQQNAWRVVEVVEIVDESDDCRSFYLRDPLGTELPDYQPGQFIMVRPALGGASQPTRCYSLSDAPGQGWWRITVKRQSAERFAGIDRQRPSLSVWLHERIGVGDCLLASGPSGQFVLDDASTGPVVLLAAGIGITPLVSMLKFALESHPSRPVHLHFQVQDPEHWPLGEVLHGWQESCPALSVTSYFSRQVPTAAPAHGRALPGKFDAQHAVDGVANCAEAAYYLCGPESWMQRLVSDLRSRGVPSHRIHFESFGTSVPESDTAAGPADLEPIEPWSLTFVRSGLQLETTSQPATIWQAASDNGLSLPAACHSGACGSCRVKLLQGQVRYRTQPQCHVADGEALACVAQPVGPVKVDA